MLLDIVKKGSVDRSVTIRIVDSTDGTPETGVAYNTSGIDLWYRREGAAKVSITEATLAALTTAHADGGFLHIGDGYCRLDLPDAAFATGANHVDVGGTVTGMVVIGGRVRLVDYDPEDTVRLGLTGLPNAAAGTNGGLPLCDANGAVKIQARYKQNQVLSHYHFLMTDSTYKNPAPGKTVVAARVIDNGSFSPGTLGSVSEIAYGLYRLSFAAADLNGAQVTVRFTADGCDDLFVTLTPEP